MKFRFRLEGLLKLRENSEYKEKVKLGEINREIYQLKNKISEREESLVQLYKEQNIVTQEGVSSHQLGHYSYLNKGLRSDVFHLQEKLKESQKEYSDQLQNLVKAKSARELISKMKEKQYRKYLKERNKVIESDIQELYSMSRR